MKKLLVQLSILGMFVAVDTYSFGKGSVERIPSKSGNYCKDEIVDWFSKNLPENTKVQKIAKIGPTENWYYYAHTDACYGTFYFDFGSMNTSNCTSAQYGSSLKYLLRVWADGNCDALVKDEYPRN